MVNASVIACDRIFPSSSQPKQVREQTANVKINPLQPKSQTHKPVLCPLFYAMAIAHLQIPLACKTMTRDHRDGPFRDFDVH